MAQLDAALLRAARDGACLKPEERCVRQHDEPLDPVGLEVGSERAAPLPQVISCDEPPIGVRQALYGAAVRQAEVDVRLRSRHDKQSLSALWCAGPAGARVARRAWRACLRTRARPGKSECQGFRHGSVDGPARG